MSTPAIDCAIGPGSPDWTASTAVRADSSSKAARADAKLRPTRSGASTVSMRRARCSAPHDGKLHHASPQPNAPSSSSTRTSSAGRSCITPNDVRTGTRTGQRSTCASTRAMAGSGERWLSRVAMGIALRYKRMVDSTFVNLQPQANNPLHRAALIAAPWFAIVALWYAVRASGLVNPSLVPAPHAVLAKFVELARERLALDIWMSTRRVFVGVFLGVLAAVPVGFAIGWYRSVRTFVEPLINFFRALPPIALIPLVIVYFGIGEVAKIAILFYASFFAGVIVMVEGIGQISPIYVRVAETLGARDAEIFTRVIVPLAVPHILTAVRVALGVAWATLVASELIAAQQGLGALIQNASSFFQLDIIYVGIVCIGLIALAMDLLLRAATRRLVAWQDRIS